MHADDKRNRYYLIRAAICDIIILGTPFRGTSFQDVAAWSETAEGQGFCSRSSGKQATGILICAARVPDELGSKE